MRAYHSWSLLPGRKSYEAYVKHMEALRDLLPAEVVELADVDLLDDGLIIKVEEI